MVSRGNLGFYGRCASVALIGCAGCALGHPRNDPRVVTGLSNESGQIVQVGRETDGDHSVMLFLVVGIMVATGLAMLVWLVRHHLKSSMAVVREQTDTAA